MASINNHILTITEPTIKLDKLVYASLGEGEGNEKANTSKGYLLLISVNGFTFTDDDIISMSLDCTGVIPSIDISVMDSVGVFDIDSFPRDGDVINFRMGTLDKDEYKDIRIDFDITSVGSPPKAKNTEGSKYFFSGIMKVPGLFSEDCKSYGFGNSLDHIEAIANDLKLGVATNIDTTDDSMNLVIPFNSRFDTLRDLVRHSYIDEDSFQVYSIDPHYYINYVNLNKLIDSEENIDMATVALEEDFADDPSIKSDEINKTKKPLILTNHDKDAGTNLYITKMSLNNKSGSTTKMYGYKRVLQYYEDDSEEGLISHEIEALVSTKLKDIEEPMKGRRDEDRYKHEIKSKYVGRTSGDPETSNTHLNYKYSAINNAQNIAEASKMSLDIELTTYNPAIHRYHKIPILIYLEDPDKIAMDNVGKDQKEKDGFDTDVKDNVVGKVQGGLVVDDFLSGFYTVSGIIYKYRAGDLSVRQSINLLRREWPSRLNNINTETVTATPIAPTAPTTA